MTETATASGKTNRPQGSYVAAKRESPGAVFYRPLTHELLLVSKANQRAFENECRTMDLLIHDFRAAKEACLAATEDLLEAQRAAAGPQRGVPQSPSVLQKAIQVSKQADAALEKAHNKLCTELKIIGNLEDNTDKILELVPISTPAQFGKPEQKIPADVTHPDGKAIRVWTQKWTYARLPKVTGLFEAQPLG